MADRRELYKAKVAEFFEGMPEGPPPEIALYVGYMRLLQRFEQGDKGALAEVVFQCTASGEELPSWARSALTEAHVAYRSGELGSWEDVFGKPWPGASRKTARQRDPLERIQIWIEVRLLQDQGWPTDDALFEEVGRRLGIGGKSTVSRLYYAMEDERRRRSGDCQKYR